MATLWLGSVLVAWHLEASANPQVSAAAPGAAPAENLEGKEVRFGVPASAAVRRLDDRDVDRRRERVARLVRRRWAAACRS